MHYGNRYINAEDAINEYIIRTSKQSFFIQKNSLLNFDTVQIGRNSSFLFEFCRLWTNINKKKIDLTFNTSRILYPIFLSNIHVFCPSSAGENAMGTPSFILTGEVNRGVFTRPF